MWGGVRRFQAFCARWRRLESRRGQSRSVGLHLDTRPWRWRRRRIFTHAAYIPSIIILEGRELIDDYVRRHIHLGVGSRCCSHVSSSRRRAKVCLRVPWVDFVRICRPLRQGRSKPALSRRRASRRRRGPRLAFFGEIPSDGDGGGSFAFNALRARCRDRTTRLLGVIPGRLRASARVKSLHRAKCLLAVRAACRPQHPS